MANMTQRITPFLWFDHEAEEAARFYTAIFEGSAIEHITHYSPESAKASGQPAGSVMTVAFNLGGQRFVALNGGPHFRFSEAISFVINCADQAEIDYFWERLVSGGDEAAQQCGWLKDRYGVSWQIVPAALDTLMSGSPARASRVMEALLSMRKLDLAALQQAAA